MCYIDIIIYIESLKLQICPKLSVVISATQYSKIIYSYYYYYYFNDYYAGSDKRHANHNIRFILKLKCCFNFNVKSIRNYKSFQHL